MFKKSIWVSIVLCLVVVLSCQDAFAWWNGAHRQGVHYHQGGRWYRHNRVWFDTVVPTLAVGAIVESLPPNCQTIIVGGLPYSTCNSAYLRPCPQGYVVVSAPVRY